MPKRLPIHIGFAEAMSTRLFNDMQDPDNQGSNFTWERLPEMAKRRAETELFLYYKKTPRNFETLRKEAGEHAQKLTQELIEANPQVRAITPQASTKRPSPR